MREMVRHMMRYHVAQFVEPRERIGQARALMDFLAGHVEHKHGPYALLLAQELQLLQRTGDDYLFHEHLEEVNTPIYFHQFAERLTAHRLQYLCETDVHTMVTDGLPDEVTATLGRITRDIVSMEQYLDFVRNRQFRATLVCHDHAVLRRNLGADSVMSLRFGLAPAGDATPVDLSPDHAQPFVTADGRTITVATPITKAALLVLRTAWPRTLEFGALHERASVLLGETGTASTNDPQVRRSLASDLLACLLRAGLEVRSFEPPIATVPGPKPRVSSVTAALARRSGFATNAHHRRVDLDPIAVELLQHLDGNHGHPELVEVLMGAVERGALRLDAPAESPSALRATLGGILDRTLADLVRHALLVLV
jgi:methyltransferase-like protein